MRGFTVLGSDSRIPADASLKKNKKNKQKTGLLAVQALPLSGGVRGKHSNQTTECGVKIKKKSEIGRGTDFLSGAPYFFAS